MNKILINFHVRNQKIHMFVWIIKKKNGILFLITQHFFKM